VGKRLILGAAFCAALLWPAPQFRLGLGQMAYDIPDLPFKGNNAFLEYTFDSETRLQFGLKYTHAQTVITRSRSLGVSGLLGAFKFYLNTLTRKTPYLGANIGWLNTSLTQERDYTARGAYTLELLAGYSLRLNEFNRLNLEYARRTIENALEPDRRLTADSWTISLGAALNTVRPLRHQTPEEGVAARKTYLRRKIAANLEQIGRYDALINKYEQKILVDGADDDLQKERRYLLDQRAALEADNRKMQELLEK
jgi:hypothetical protein